MEYGWRGTFGWQGSYGEKPEPEPEKESRQDPQVRKTIDTIKTLRMQRDTLPPTQPGTRDEAREILNQRIIELAATLPPGTWF